MSRLTDMAGAVLLAASLLLNAALLLRGSPGAPERPAGPAPNESTRSQSLAAERERHAALTARLRELEAARAASPSPAAAAPSPQGRSARFRAKFRSYLQLSLDDGAYSVPEHRLAMNDATQEFLRATTRRAQDPAAYAECLKELFEATLEDKTLGLMADQSKALRGILDQFRESLVRASPESVIDRQLLDLQALGAAMTQAIGVINDDQYSRLNNILGGIGVVSTGSQYSVGEAELLDTLQRRWTTTYRLEDAQAPAVNAALRSLVDTLLRISNEPSANRDGQSSESVEDYDLRVRSLRAQGAALKLLENVLTPAQVERIRSLPLSEFQIDRPTPESEK